MLPAYVTAVSLATACALLSVVVVLRRWAFIGEGISHAGFGGIGTAWLLSLALPGLTGDGATYAVAVAFCLSVAMAIAYVSRSHGGAARSPGDEAIAGDAAIGIFLVASVAWGFLALGIYSHFRRATVADWERYLVGDLAGTTGPRAVAALCLCGTVVLCLAALRKEILFYTLDPLLAQVSGVRAGLVHYLLLLLLAAVIVLGMRLVGNFLVPALLVLPGSTALLLSRRLPVVTLISLASSVVGTFAGLIVARRYAFPPGPPIVLALFLGFVAAFAVSRVRRA